MALLAEAFLAISWFAKIVGLGAGAAGVASMNLLLEMGAKLENVYMVDRKGVIRAEREDLTRRMTRHGFTWGALPRPVSLSALGSLKRSLDRGRSGTFRTAP